MTAHVVSMTVPQYRRHECSIDGRPVHLRPKAAELLALLLVTPPPCPVAYNTLVEALWPDPDTQALDASGVIHTTALWLRQLGVPIETRWGFGFYIAEEARGGRRAPPAPKRCPACCQPEAAAPPRIRYAPRTELTPRVRDIRGQLRTEIARAGWSETARRAGVERTTLHRAFGANPRCGLNFNTIAEVARALGFELTLTRKAAS